MISWFVSLPLAVRLAIVFVAAMIAARFANWAIYSWAHFSRQLGPWSTPPKNQPAHTWQDHLPVVGWLRLRRESNEYGRGYWVRPL